MRTKAVKKPLISAIVPVEPGGDLKACLAAIKKMGMAKAAPAVEVLVAQGRQPSRQRNLAAARAKGAWLLFLDSDSRPAKDLAQRLLAAALENGAMAAGGPNQALEHEPWLGRAFSRVLSSYFGSMSARARYAGFGQIRESSEKELILCNLLIRSSAFKRLGGFREDLYPNEENEFLNRLQAAGGKLCYVPEAVVSRPRRLSVPAFGKQAFNYGRGRMRQMLANFFPGDLVHLLPLLALFYALSGAYLWRQPLYWGAPLAYAAADALACTSIFLGYGDPAASLLCLLLFPLRHFAYAFGLLAGLGGPQQQAPDPHISISSMRWKP